jgi:hypothetical protein
LAAFFLRFLSTPERNRTAGGNLTKTLAEMKIARDLAGGNWTKTSAETIHDTVPWQVPRLQTQNFRPFPEITG